MVQYCVAYGCKETSCRGTSISFHGFPSDVNLRKKWELSLRRENFQASKYSRVCSKHFAAECFDMEAFGKGRKLKKGSVPSIFDFSEHLQTQFGKRNAKKRAAASTDFRESGISMLVDEINNVMRSSNSCEMDIKVEIKEEDPFSDISSQDEREFFPMDIATEIKSDALHLNNECDMAIKTEFKSEPPLPEVCLQEEIEFFPVKIEQCSNDQEINNKEDCWLETFAGTSAGCDEIKDGDFTPVKSPRLCKAVSGDSSDESLLLPAEDSGKDTSFSNEKDYPECDSQESGVPKLLAIEEHVHSEQFSESSDEGKTNHRAVSLKQQNFIHKGERLHKCDICEKRFTSVSNLKRHAFIHGNERPHKCDICQRSFVSVYHLKRHKFIHVDKKPHKCKTCGKSFIQLSFLKFHYLIHEGKRPHSCEICEKSFTQLSHLKEHSLIHEGKKPHKCETCDKRFTRLSHLKVHSFIHEGKKPHKCETCEKSFSQLSLLKVHNLIHEGKKPYKCETCEKRFTRLSHLKRHGLIHKRHKDTPV